MKKLLLAALVAGLAHVAVAAEPVKELKTDEQKVSYGFGKVFGSRIQSDIPDLDMAAFAQGMQDGFDKKQSLMTEEEIQKVLQAYQEKMQQKQLAAFDDMAKQNLEKGQAFLKQNGAKKDVKTTKSGLQYSVDTEGSGDMPKATDTVTVHYTGTLIDGTVFDSSVQRGEPATFPVGGVIAGWTEALQLMKKGAKYRLFIPSDLAYGPGGNRSIGPNETLIFDVELIEIAKGS